MQEAYTHLGGVSNTKEAYAKARHTHTSRAQHALRFGLCTPQGTPQYTLTHTHAHTHTRTTHTQPTHTRVFHFRCLLSLLHLGVF